MEKRALGDSGIEIAPLMLGGNVFGWTADEAASFSLLDAFVDAGFDAIDTADVYSAWVPGHKGGESEATIGRWFKQSGKRDKVVIATKLGMLAPYDKLTAANIEAACEASLKRLQTDRIDLYQAHKDDQETPLEETLEAFERLKTAGKMRAVGASNYEAARLAEALAAGEAPGAARYATLQPLYNLMERGFEAELQSLCVKAGVGVIPYYSLASGFLTGKYRSKEDLGQSPRGRGLAKYLDERGMKVLAALDQVAEAQAATPAQVALAWLASRPAVVAPIASATSLEQLGDILNGARLTLTPDEIKTLDAASAPA